MVQAGRSVLRRDLMTININKLFPFLSIRTKLIVAFSALSFIPLAVVGVLGVYNNVSTMNEIALRSLTTDVSRFNERVERFLSGVQADLSYLGDSPAFRRYLGVKDSDALGLRLPASGDLLSGLVAFASSKAFYYRIRFVDAVRGERFRVERRDGTYLVVPEDELMDGRFRFYRLLTDGMTDGQVAVAPVELVDHLGTPVSVVSAAMRVSDANGEEVGILIADIFATEFFEVGESGIALDPERVMAIVTGGGDLFYHSESKTEWTTLLTVADQQELFAGFSHEVVAEILGGGSGIARSRGRVVAYAPVFVARFTGASTYHLVESANRSVILGPAKRFATIFIGLLLIFLAVSVGLGYVATSQLAGPIGKLQRGAEIVAQGNYNHRLTIDTNDEIEQLSKQFNRMAEALSEREGLLADQQRKLEGKVRARTRELRSEKDKLQAVLDNVSSALILLDEDRNVISASAGTESVLGIAAADVVGKNARTVVPEGEAREVVEDAAPQGVTLITLAEADGKRRFLEHYSVAVALGEIRGASLEILTDVTARKQIEKHMLRAEKLAATGEMAAIIAHEIRNSLTSVKMILQLQREKSKMGDERRSLDVAIGSIRRTEDVVNSLLRFARPTKLQLQLAEVNDIIESSVAFITPIADKQGVSVMATLASELPQASLDAQQLQEAFINVLLNAVQVLERGGVVQVDSCQKVLDEAVEDFVYADAPEDHSDHSGQRVSIEAGAPVIVVTIRDSGPGVDKEQAVRMFDPFFTTKQEGTGLGLTMVKRTVNRHGGTVTAANAPEGGALFTIILPVGVEP